MQEVVQEVSRDQLVLKVVIHRLLQLRLTLHLRSHQTTKPQEVDITTLKLMISRQVQQELQDIHLNHAHQLEQDSQDLKLEPELVHHIQEHKDLLAVLLTQELKDHLLVVHLTQLLANLNAQLDPQQEVAPQPSQVHNKDSVSDHKDKALEVLDQELKVVAAAAVDHHQANKMTAKKEIIQPFPENQMSTTQSIPKFQKPRSTATSKNSQDTTPMSKLVAKFSIFAH